MAEEKNIALKAQEAHTSAVQNAADYIENFDILETITNVGNDEVFTPRKICGEMLDSLPIEVWHNPNYRWLNPCTKNGIFEREIAIRLDEGLKEIIPDQELRRKHILQKMIFSIGLTKFTSHVARRTLYYCNVANKKCDGIQAPDGHFVNGYSIGNGSWFDTQEGNILTPNIDHKFQGVDENAKCTFCGVKKSSKYVDPLQREQYAYEFMHVNHLVLEKHLQKRFFNGDRNMKFDIIIGNPPYQLSDGGAQASARPIYQYFIQQAKFLKPKYLCMIIPSRWMAGGKGLDEFRKEMINDKSIKVLHDYANMKMCFPTCSIPGGVCYFVREDSYSGKCNITQHQADGTVTTSKRYLFDGVTDIVLRDEFHVSIVKKVLVDKTPRFSNIVSSLKPYGLRTDFFVNPDKYALPPISKKPIPNGCRIIGRGLELRYVKADYPFPRSINLWKWKILIGRANGGAGIIGEVIPCNVIAEPIIAKPGDACLETYLEIGPFNTEQETLNCLTYIKSRFFRLLLGVKKASQDFKNKSFDFIPILDFSEPITDEILFEKFGFSEEEIAYAEKYISSPNWIGRIP